MINVFKAITLKWWQIGIFKVTALAFGISVGVIWSDFFEGWINSLLILFVLGWLYLAYVWVANWKK